MYLFVYARAIFNTSCRIIVQTTSCVGSNIGSQGILIWGQYTNVSFAFIFNPTGNNHTVDSICLQLVYWDDETQPNNARFYLNNVELGTSITKGPACHNQVLLVQDQLLCTSLHQGTNIVTISTFGDFYLQELSLLVDYQYQT